MPNMALLKPSKAESSESVSQPVIFRCVLPCFTCHIKPTKKHHRRLPIPAILLGRAQDPHYVREQYRSAGVCTEKVSAERHLKLLTDSGTLSCVTGLQQKRQAFHPPGNSGTVTLSSASPTKLLPHCSTPSNCVQQFLASCCCSPLIPRKQESCLEVECDEIGQSLKTMDNQGKSKHVLCTITLPRQSLASCCAPYPYTGSRSHAWRCRWDQVL